MEKFTEPLDKHSRRSDPFLHGCLSSRRSNHPCLYFPDFWSSGKSKKKLAKQPKKTIRGPRSRLEWKHVLKHSVSPWLQFVLSVLFYWNITHKIHHFKMYKSTDSRAFTEPYTRHCFLILEHFIPPRRNAILISSLAGLDVGLPQIDLIIHPFIQQTFIAHLPRLAGVA